MSDEKYLTTKRVAERLNVYTRTVQRWIRLGKLPAIRLDGGYRFRSSAVEYFVSQRETV